MALARNPVADPKSSDFGFVVPGVRINFTVNVSGKRPRCQGQPPCFFDHFCEKRGCARTKLTASIYKFPTPSPFPT
jgi:hypothetical protein